MPPGFLGHSAHRTRHEKTLLKYTTLDKRDSRLKDTDEAERKLRMDETNDLIAMMM